MDFKTELLPLFLLRILAAVCLGYVYAETKIYGDYWSNNSIGYKESYFMLINSPTQFIKEFFQSNYGSYDNFLGSSQSYWNDLGEKFLYKLLAFTNILTHGNYYLNAIFVNTIAFLGSVLLYKVFLAVYKSRFIAVLCSFLIPSTLVFSSGIHKDAEIFFLLSVFVYCLYFGLTDKMTFKRLFFLLISLLLMILIKDYVGLTALLSSTFLILSAKIKRHPAKLFLAVAVMGVLLLMSTFFIPTEYNPIKKLSEKQENMLKLGEAKTQVEIGKLEPNTLSLIRNIPVAFKNTVLLPTAFKNANKFILAFAIENLLFLILFFAALYKPDKKIFEIPFFYFSITAIFLLFLIIGLTTPNLGTIVRYRSIVLPFLCATLLYINKEKLKHIKI